MEILKQFVLDSKVELAVCRREGSTFAMLSRKRWNKETRSDYTARHFISGPCWKNLMDRVDTVNGWIEANVTDETLSLGKNRHLGLVKFQDKMYVCFMKMVDEAVVFGDSMNLTTEAWKELLKHWQEVTNLLPMASKRPADPTTSLQVSPPPTKMPKQQMVTQYRYSRVDQVEKGPWSYDRFKVLRSTKQWPQDKSRFTIERREVPAPSTDTLVECAYVGLMENVIAKLAQAGCHGCSIDHPSQKQHMVQGCLAEMCELWDVYSSVAERSVNVDQVHYVASMLACSLELDEPTLEQVNDKVDKLRGILSSERPTPADQAFGDFVAACCAENI